MEKCELCGISGGKVFLFDVISNGGIIKICRNCYKDNKMPLVNKEKSLFRGPEEQESVYEKLASLSGYTKKELSKANSFNRVDADLRKVVDQNFKQNLGENGIDPTEIGLVRNFHWVIMRARRAKHFTQKQLAEVIEEPEPVIKYLELGKVLRDNLGIIGKIENCLSINLREYQEVTEPEPEPIPVDFSNKTSRLNPLNGKTEVDFEEIKSKRDLTISDLQELKKRKEQKIFRRDTDFD